MSWSDSQLRILRALGHEPMRLAPAGAGFVAAPLVGAALGRDPELVHSRPGAAATDMAALAAAIARAAGGRDLAALALDLEGLRRQPALKRALWPQLRRLRRGH